MEKTFSVFIFCLILILTSCGRCNSVQKQDDNVWFVKYQTGILAGKCYHMYHNRIYSTNGQLTFQNRSMLPVTVSLTEHTVTRKQIFSSVLIPGEIKKCLNLLDDKEYCVSLIIEDGEGAKNGIVGVYSGDAPIVPFNYIEAKDEQQNVLINTYNKLFNKINF